VGTCLKIGFMLIPSLQSRGKTGKDATLKVVFAGIRYASILLLGTDVTLQLFLRVLDLASPVQIDSDEFRRSK